MTGLLPSRLRMNDDLALALSLADTADGITMRHFRTSFAIRTKADRTPVTEVDEAVEPQIAHWDMAAVQVIVEEAGGRFTTLGGEARADGGSAVSTNGLLHDAVLEALRA